MTDERREPDQVTDEPRTVEKDSASAAKHNRRMREIGRTYEVEIPPGIRTTRAIRNRQRRVIE